MSVVPIRPEMLAKVMNDPEAAGLPGRTPFKPYEKVRMGIYRVGEPEIQQCPGCGGKHWLVGRTTSECAFCGWALLLI